MDNVLE